MPAPVLVAIPAYNEAGSVAQVVRSVQDTGVAHEILVVDDGSTDLTGAVARSAGAHVLTLPFNVGVGGAMRTAFLYARRKGYPYVVQVDADGQHDPGQIETLVAGLDRASVVIGSRFADPQQRSEVGISRRPVMKLLAWAIGRISHCRLTDTTSGFRAFDARAIALYARHYPAEYLGDTVEATVIAARARLPITEVPVQMGDRMAGQPSQSGIKSVLYVGRVLLALISATAPRSVPDFAPIR